MPKNKISKKRLNAIISNIEKDIHNMRSLICKHYINLRHKNDPKLMKELEDKLNDGLDKILDNSNYTLLIDKNNFGSFKIYMGDNNEWMIKLSPPEETKDEN